MPVLIHLYITIGCELIDVCVDAQHNNSWMSAQIRRYIREKEDFEFKRGYTPD